MRPKITVVLPVYNGVNFLEETLQSVLAQSYAPCEVLVIDDGSTDDTATVAQRFGDRVRVISQFNAGVSAARNRGVAEARTTWVALLDHDDVWHPAHLEHLACAMEANPDADVVYTGGHRLVWRTDDQGFRVDEPWPQVPQESVHELLRERCCLVTSAIAVRVSTVRDAGGFDPRYSNAQDWDLLVRLARQGARFVLAPGETVLYRIHPSSRSHCASRFLKYTAMVLDEDILPFLPAWRRWQHGQRVRSRLEGETAILLRESGEPGGLNLMLRSIRRWPWHETRRYAIALHMLLKGYALRHAERTQTHPLPASLSHASGRHAAARPSVV